jgi:hypothetical protein
LLSVLNNLANAGYKKVAAVILITLIVCHYSAKIFTVIMICKNPNLSNEKVEAITKMISKKLFNK